MSMFVFASSASARFSVEEYMDEVRGESAAVSREMESQLVDAIARLALMDLREAREAVRAAHSVLDKFCYEHEMGEKWRLAYEYLDYAEERYDELYRETPEYKETLAWLANPANLSDINYSDIYKDIYGVRP